MEKNCNDSANSANDIQKAFLSLQVRYWLDEDFKKELERNPNVILKQNGIPVSMNVKIDILQNSKEQGYFVIPAKPSNLSDSDLQVMAEAGTIGSAGCVGSAGTFCGTAGTFGTLGTIGTHKF